MNYKDTVEADQSLADPFVLEVPSEDVAPASNHEMEMLVGPMPTADRLVLAKDALARRAFDEAERWLDLTFLPADTPVELAIGWAETLAKMPPYKLADELFERLMSHHPSERKLFFTYARRLNGRGLLMRAAKVLREAPVPARNLAQNAFAARVFRMIDLISRHEGRELGIDEDCRILAMKHAIISYRDRSVRALPKDRMGRLALITGSLGPGGAERQLSRTAAELELARCRDGHVGGIPIDAQVEVIVRSHGPERQHDFYLPDLVAAGVKLSQIDQMDPTAAADLAIDDADLALLLDYLPAKVAYGLRRLVPHFRQRDTDVVSIWQDGACLFAGLAAVVAGIPRIQLVIRGLPPVVRKHMFQPEYETMYRALAEIPGVEFVSNSKAAAAAYAHWLDQPLERFEIVYNGVPRMDTTGTPDLETEWQDFAEKTADATHTIGGVFRFDTDKRPLTWIRFAARYIRRYPDARFLLVGGGRLLDEAVDLARGLGVADRIHFVGRSVAVGYWMKRMDVLVLMSSFEGLPNVLIEAQYLGVPVVSTPAGGASECFIEGVTGHLLGSANKTDLEEACEKVAALRGRAQDPAIFEPASRYFLEKNFAVSGMLETFLRVACKAAG